VDILENQFARVRSFYRWRRERGQGGVGDAGSGPPPRWPHQIHALCVSPRVAPTADPKQNTMAEARYGGAYVPKEAEPVDPKPAIDAACHSGCTKAWDIYKECEARIEAKGRGECSGYYMDYFKCIDHCATKKLFKALN